MTYRIGVICNADGYACVPLQSTQCLKNSIRLLAKLLPAYCRIDLRLKPGNNSSFDYISLLISSFFDHESCQISLSDPQKPLADWMLSKDILISYSPSSAFEYAASLDKLVYLIKNQCNFFPSYIIQDDLICPLLSPFELVSLITAMNDPLY